SKREAVGRVKSISQTSGRMVLRNVKSLEVVEIGFDLPIVLDVISERDEDVFESLAQQSDWMTMSSAWAAARQSDVDAFTGCALVFDITLQTKLDFMQQHVQPLFSRLHQLTEARSLFW